jgi:hypothetical protein
MNQVLSSHTEAEIASLSAATETRPLKNTKRSFPLYLQVVAGFVAGATVGVVFGERPIIFNVSVAEFGTLGMLVIRLLKTLAIPLVLFAILSGILKSSISGRQGKKLFLICAVNVCVAMVIGLTIIRALDRLRLLFCFVNCRKKQARQDRDNRDHDQQFDQREAFYFRRTISTSIHGLLLNSGSAALARAAICFYRDIRLARFFMNFSPGGHRSSASLRLTRSTRCSMLNWSRLAC